MNVYEINNGKIRIPLRANHELENMMDFAKRQALSRNFLLDINPTIETTDAIKDEFISSEDEIFDDDETKEEPALTEAQKAISEIERLSLGYRAKISYCNEDGEVIKTEETAITQPQAGSKMPNFFKPETKHKINIKV